VPELLSWVPAAAAWSARQPAAADGCAVDQAGFAVELIAWRQRVGSQPQIACCKTTAYWAAQQ